MKNGAKIRIISGEVKGTKGPVRDIVIDPEYLDFMAPPRSEIALPAKPGHTVFAYVFEGKACFCKEKNPFTYEVEGTNYFDIPRSPFATDGNLVLFEDGEQVFVSTEEEPARFLLISGRPLGETIAWYGPIVMNTQEELRVAFEEYNNATFIKRGKT